jgi:uncharacterized protein (DUF433 family)
LGPSKSGELAKDPRYITRARNGWTHDQILDSYAQLSVDDIRACLAYASEILHAEKVYPLKSR